MGGADSRLFPPTLVSLELRGTRNWGATAKMGRTMRALDLPQSNSRVHPPILGYARQYPFPRQSYQTRSHLVHKDIHRGVERDPGAGGHGQEAEPHAHVEPLADAGTVQQLWLLCRPGRVLRRLLRRLSAATWRLGGRSAGGHGIGGPSQSPRRETRMSSLRADIRRLQLPSTWLLKTHPGCLPRSPSLH